MKKSDENKTIKFRLFMSNTFHQCTCANDLKILRGTKIMDFIDVEYDNGDEGVLFLCEAADGKVIEFTFFEDGCIHLCERTDFP